MLGLNKNNSLVFDPPLRAVLGSVQWDVFFIHLLTMGAEQVRKRILECPGVGPGGSFNASFFNKKLFPLARCWLGEEIKRKREQAHLESAVQWRGSCMLRSGRMNRS